MKIIQYDNTVHNKDELIGTSIMNFRIIIDNKVYKYNKVRNELDCLGILRDYDIIEIKEIKDE